MSERSPIGANAIEIRIEEISQIFHTLDPFPFRKRDLDKDAEEFIVPSLVENMADCGARLAPLLHICGRVLASALAAVALSRPGDH
jgi:hypothetical protein